MVGEKIHQTVTVKNISVMTELYDNLEFILNDLHAKLSKLQMS